MARKRILKNFDIVYSTKGGKGMIARDIKAYSITEAKTKFRKQMRSSSVSKILSVIKMR